MPTAARPLAQSLLVITAVLSTACGDATSAETSVCDRAAAHLASCSADLPAPLQADGPCDEATARSTLATPCSAVSTQFADTKSDSPFKGAACNLGFFSACAVPNCPAVPDVDVCGDLLVYDDCRLCAIYDCREAISQCGPSGYLEGYAGRYCKRYALVTEPRVSPAASAWLKRVRRCLAEYLETAIPEDADCETIRTMGTDSHAQCYVETGFCDLSVSDWMGVLLSIDFGDAPLRVVLKTGQGCLAEWLDR